MELEKGKAPGERLEVPQQSGSIQRNIKRMCETSTRDGYLKFFRTAYQLAINPTLPMTQFKTLIKVQRQNGVCLLQGKNVASKIISK